MGIPEREQQLQRQTELGLLPTSHLGFPGFLTNSLISSLGQTDASHLSPLAPSSGSCWSIALDTAASKQHPLQADYPCCNTTGFPANPSPPIAPFVTTHSS